MNGYLDYFKKISSIPRQSGNEALIAEYLCKFAESHSLKYYTDELHNVIIYKPAGKGFENCEAIGLQCHTDMVCEKNSGCTHNFDTEGLTLKIDGDYIHAEGTTLGADNGIGIAYILAILDSDIVCPALECIFTVEEETTMDGAAKLDASKLSTDKIISFDNFSENEFWIGSVASDEWILSSENTPVPDGRQLEIYFGGFKGGHSGMDIGDEKIGNPIAIGLSLLNRAGCKIISVCGGTRVNVIPRECTFKVIAPENRKEFMCRINNEFEEIKKRYDGSCMTISDASAQAAESISGEALTFVSELKTGAIFRNNQNDVIVSCNLGKVCTKDGITEIIVSVRSNREALSRPLIQQIEESVHANGIKVRQYEKWNGYEQPKDGELITLAARAYEEHFGRKPRLKEVQACLECEFFSQKINNLQYAAMAPNIFSAHSPEEKMSLSSADRMWSFICELIPKCRFEKL